MTNPYRSPTNMQQEIGIQPVWYVWFCKAYQPAWWIGTELIVASWLNVVTPTVGCIGFAMAGAAALGSYILPSFAGVRKEDYVLLDSRLVKNKGDAFYNAMEGFRNSATLVYDGVAFGFRPNNEIACGNANKTMHCDSQALPSFRFDPAGIEISILSSDKGKV